MAGARQTTKVGSMAWIAKERVTFGEMEAQDLEDFSYSARHEFEWLNEHMADIFERNTLDMAEIMKTPGRLRGKTPLTARRRLGTKDRSPGLRTPASKQLFNEVFASWRKTPSGTSSNPFGPENAELVNEKEASPVRPQLAKSPTKSPEKLPSPARAHSPAKEPASDPPVELSLPPPNFADSGFFTSSNPNSQVDQISQPKRMKTRSSSVSQVYVDAITSAGHRGSNGGRTTRQSYRTAAEDETIPASSPIQEDIAMSKPPTSKEVPEELRSPIRQASPVKQSSPVEKTVSPVEPRRSGRIAGRVSIQEAAQEESAPASPPEPEPAIEREPEVAIEQPSYPTLPQPEEPKGKEDVPVSPPAEEEPNSPTEEQSFSESPQPEKHIIRKSSMNFASLPAREPLTNKKKSLGPKAARESHLDQVRQNGAKRASWMNKKKSTGKSLGGRVIGNSAEAEDEPREPKTGEKRKSDVHSSNRWQKVAKDDSDAAFVIQETKETVKIPTKGGDDDSESDVRAHNKSSTQRLHDKIQQLGKLNKARATRSFPAPISQTESSVAEYPNLPTHEDDIIAKTPTELRKQPTIVSARANQIEEQRAIFETSIKQPVPPSHTDAAVLGTPKKDVVNDSDPTKTHSPLPRPLSIRTNSQPYIPAENRNTGSTAGVSRPSSPLVSPKTQTPESPIASMKAHTSSMIKKAKEMWMKSSVASASAKVEILSPPLRRWPGAEHLQESYKRDAAATSRPQTRGNDKELYPDLASTLLAESGDKYVEKSFDDIREELPRTRQTKPLQSRPPNAPRAVSPKPVGRVTRNSKSRGEANREEEAEKYLEQQRIQQEQEEALRKSNELLQRQQEAILKKEKEELRKKQQDELQEKRKEEEKRKAKKQRSIELSDNEDSQPETEAPRSRFGSADPERPQSRLQKGLRFQKASDKTRVVRGAKEPPKPKPAPVSIKIASASQLQDQRHKNTIGVGNSLVSALKNSFEPSQPAQSSQQIHLSSSQGSIRSNSSASGPKQPKSLIAAANQLKKEQEEKERKAAAKREIDQRRADKLRQQQEEEYKRQQAKKRTTPGPTSTGKTLARTQPLNNLRQMSQEPEASRKVEYQKSAYPKGAIKRVQPDNDNDPSQQIRIVPARLGVAAYQQEGPKKRRTGEYEEPMRQEPPKHMKPPIRSSTAQKEMISKMMPHGYVPVSSSNAPPSILKNKPGPQVDSIKYSKEKIRFAEPAGPSASSGQSGFKTPGAKTVKSKTPKESPLYENGENIVLPDIPTDSEDEDDYPPSKNDFSLPQWAESPELRELLRRQQTVDPEAIFGPIAKLDMDAIFKGTDDRKSRFRARTSSANWSGQDRLTQAEIQRDLEARRHMQEQGKWTFGTGM
ncbi:hypothetical protein EDC01DRAFT_613996 [Geopyxis carbonaria]|nr:hypothetical protein EDC01DRAFT_613996 [Geopyxis carbonaria]